jgi:dipeptidyl aminopeptidase/acylaminoacyl peptidase
MQEVLMIRRSALFRYPLAALVLLTWFAPAAAAAPLSVKDLLAVKWVGSPALSPDGATVAFVVRLADHEKNTRRSTIWTVATAGGAPRQLTAPVAGNDSAPCFSPDGKQLAFVSTRGGGEPQIWLLPLRGGEAVQLSKISTGVGGPLVFSPDGKLIAFASSVYPDCKDDACNAKRIAAEKKSKATGRVIDGLLFRHWNDWRDARRSHVLVQPVAGGLARDLTPGPHDAPPISLGGSPDYAFSPDGKKLAYVANTDKVVAISTNNDVFEVAVEGGKPTRLTTGKGNDYEPRYSPDGKLLAWLSMATPGYEADRPRIMVRELGESRRGLPIRDWSSRYDGHPLGLRWLPDSTGLVFAAPHHGLQELFLCTTAGVKRLSKGLSAEDPLALPGGRGLVFVDEAADRAPEIARIGLDGKGYQRLTSLNAWLSKKAGLRRAEHVWFEGAAGAKIHAVLLKPPGFQKGKRYPALVMIHGGPQGATGDDFHPRWNLQMFATEGYVVLGVNFHGSVGFGQRFSDAIGRDWGGKPLTDVLRGLDWLEQQSFIQPKKVCAAGASYGGYLVNWIATQTRRFSCLISHAGLFNMESKYGSTEELWFPEREFGGTPWTARELYRKLSPHSYAEKIRTPTLVIHGQRDYRVPVEQAFQTFTALQRQGVPSRLLYFPDEDHFVQKPHNIELWWGTMRDWLGRYLKK